MKLTKSVLKAAAIDLNDTAGLEPEIGYDDEMEKNTLSKMDVKELKEAILDEAGEFRKTDKYKDQTWDVLVELGVEIAVERAEGDEPDPKGKSTPAKKAAKTKTTPAKKAVAKKAVAKKSTPAKKAAKTKTTPAKKVVAKKAVAKKSTPAKEKKPGVISTIIDLITAKPMTREQIVVELVKKFPERKEEGMLSTVKSQVPTTFRRDRNLKVEKDSKGRFSIK